MINHWIYFLGFPLFKFMVCSLDFILILLHLLNLAASAKLKQRTHSTL